jgi:RHS repeat-associated protein
VLPEPVENVYSRDVVEACSNRFFALAADLKRRPPVALPTASQKTRAWNFCRRTSGRHSSRHQRSPESATGSKACGYKMASGRPKWLNRDPIGERGGINLYRFVKNRPTSLRDRFGLFEGEDPNKPINCEQLEAEMTDLDKIARDPSNPLSNTARAIMNQLQQVWDEHCDDGNGGDPVRDPVPVPSPGKKDPILVPIGCRSMPRPQPALPIISPSPSFPGFPGGPINTPPPFFPGPLPKPPGWVVPVIIGIGIVVTPWPGNPVYIGL